MYSSKSPYGPWAEVHNATGTREQRTLPALRASQLRGSECHSAAPDPVKPLQQAFTVCALCVCVCVSVGARLLLVQVAMSFQRRSTPMLLFTPWRMAASSSSAVGSTWLRTGANVQRKSRRYNIVFYRYNRSFRLGMKIMPTLPRQASTSMHVNG